MAIVLEAILFDFDGTLIDSANDLAAALNAVRAERSEPLVPVARLRPHTARGARSMIGEAYGIAPEHAEYETLRNRFLHHYSLGLLNHTQLWVGMPEVISELQNRSIPWGIVTNKAERFTTPIVAGLKITPHVVVCGDTVGKTKPHPEPLLFAAQKLRLPAAQIAYIGDALSDMQAARAAGMLAVGAGYSDFVDTHSRAQWPVDIWVQQPSDLLALPYAK